MAGGQQLDRRHWICSEVAIVSLDSGKQDAKVNLAAFQHGQDVRDNRLDQFHLYAWIALRVSVQERRENGFDLHRRRRYSQHTGGPVSEQLRAFGQRAGMAQEIAAVPQQLLALGGQDKATAHAIE